jgi:toxin HigB-1
MHIRYADSRLERLEVDASYRFPGLGRDVIKGFRKVVQWIRDAADERDLYALKSLHYEKLAGNRSHQRSMRLNKQWRLIIEIESSADGRRIVVIKIEDYH